MSQTEINFGFSPDHDTVGKRLKAVREGQRYTRKALSDLSGVGEKTIERYEYGTTDVRLEKLIALADVLRLHPAELAFGPMVKTSPLVSLDQQGWREIQSRGLTGQLLDAAKENGAVEFLQRHNVPFTFKGNFPNEQSL